jgi:hypothetical protein
MRRNAKRFGVRRGGAYFCPPPPPQCLVSFLVACVRENFKFFKLVFSLPQLQKNVHTKFSVFKIINLKFIFVTIFILVATKIVFACFSKPGTKQVVKYKGEIKILYYSYVTRFSMKINYCFFF